MWLPPGGHIGQDELPEQAAIREVKEETGLDVKLYNPDQSIDITSSEQLHRPMHILLEDINKFHQHIDLIYYAAADTFDVQSDEGETDDLRWFDQVALKKSKIQDDVRILGKEAMNLLGK